ncbi:MAG: ATP-binding protein [Actinocatenispora sp.]
MRAQRLYRRVSIQRSSEVGFGAAALLALVAAILTVGEIVSAPSGSARWYAVTVLVVLIVLLLVVVSLFLLVNKGVIRPLARLGEDTQLVADGDPGYRVRGSGFGALTSLSSDIEGMRRRITHELDSRAEDQQTLEEQAEELRRSNAELEQFAYVASHDLQEPLRKVASFCQLLERRYGDKLDDSARQYIGFAVDGAKRMQELINDLLAFSRVGRLHDRREPVALAATLDNALRNLSVSLEESEAEVVVPPELPGVTGDRTLLTMVWQNLIGNAVKFRTPDSSPRVVIEAEETDGECQITVTDNGIGIDAQFADKIFVIFQRLHSRDTYGGTGIGLALCRKIVEYHGGRIWLDTDHRDGARFILTVPVLPPADDPADPGRETVDVPTPRTQTVDALASEGSEGVD